MTLEAMIDGLSRDEQLIAMELLWKRISQGENTFKPPQWHRDVVADRVERVRNGSAQLVDWAAARQQLSDRLK